MVEILAGDVVSIPRLPKNLINTIIIIMIMKFIKRGAELKFLWKKTDW